MSDLTLTERRRLEQLFQMDTGYVLNFSDRTIREFVHDATGCDLADSKYQTHGSSKAKRLRAFWDQETNRSVGRLTTAMIDYMRELEGFVADPGLVDACKRIAARLIGGAVVADLDALRPSDSERDFEVLAREIHDTIQRNQPDAGLDRLHTFIVKYMRILCQKHGVPADRDKPLHSLFGEYVKRLRDAGQIESEMTLRILKTSISTLEAFNDVRNNRSLAHDNQVLNYRESLLIFNNVASLIRFIKQLEADITPVFTEGTAD